jgi:hypothetical protein
VIEDWREQGAKLFKMFRDIHRSTDNELAADVAPENGTFESI